LSILRQKGKFKNLKIIAMEDVVVPLVMFGATFGIVYVITSARHKEKMALIEKGADPTLFKRQQFKFSQYNVFKYGLLLVGIAIGIILAGIMAEIHFIDDVAAYFSSILFFGGLALIAAFLLRNKLDKENQ
jgi:hypothetical protein